MATEKPRLIDANALKEKRTYLWDEALGTCECVLVEDIDKAPAVDAVELPKVGKIGECVLWKPDSFEAMSVIEAIAVTDKGMRYCFRWRSVPVDSPKILQVMSREEAERWLEDVYREKID